VSNDLGLMFFNDHEATTVEQIAERIIPGDEEKPGARSAGVVYYIDRAIAGFSRELQPAYRSGLRELDALCVHHHARRFADLPETLQDELVRRFLGPEIAADRPAAEKEEPGALLPGLFAIIREHTVEGFFCDPLYGGNRDAIGWRLVGFPGAHWGYTAEQMEPGFDSSKIIIKTLSDLRADLADRPGNERFYGPARG
jgi:gluconate 2-dehydrogenase gamma chain